MPIKFIDKKPGQQKSWVIYTESGDTLCPFGALSRWLSLQVQLDSNLDINVLSKNCAVRKLGAFPVCPPFVGCFLKGFTTRKPTPAAVKPLSLAMSVFEKNLKLAQRLGEP